MTTALPDRHYEKRPVPKALTPSARELLLEAWSWEWPDTKACIHAGLSISQLNHALKVDPTLKSTRDLLRTDPQLNAKRNVAKVISEGDIRTSKWFLERRDPEYSTKQEVSVNHTHSIAESEVTKELLAFIERNRLIPGDDRPIIDVTPTEPGDNGTDAADKLLDDPLLQ